MREPHRHSLSSRGALAYSMIQYDLMNFITPIATQHHHYSHSTEKTFLGVRICKMGKTRPMTDLVLGCRECLNELTPHYKDSGIKNVQNLGRFCLQDSVHYIPFNGWSPIHSMSRSTFNPYTWYYIAVTNLFTQRPLTGSCILLLYICMSCILHSTVFLL